MCYGPLTNGNATEQSIPALLRSEWYPAIRNGVLAAVIVLAVLLLEGTPLWIILATTLGALTLGIVLHQFVLLVGALALRMKAHWSGLTSRPTH